MSEIHIDLSARVLPQDHDIFVVRPGKGSRMYPDFVERSEIMLELPGLEFHKELPVDEQPQLNAQIRRAVALRRWYRAGRAEDAQPSVDIADYSDGPRDGSLTQHIGIVKAFFERMKKGTLVVVPPSAFSMDAYIGEVIDEPLSYHRSQSPRLFQGSFLLSRRVKWLAQVPKRQLPSSLLNALEKPNAVFLAGKSVRSFFYDRAFGSYNIEGRYASRFDVTGEDYNLDDDIRLSAFFKMVSGNYKALQEGHPRTALSIGDAALTTLGEFAPDIRTNINSPGFLTLGASAITPLVISALLSLAVFVGPEAATAAGEDKIVFGNSGAPPGDECSAEVYAETKRQLLLMGLDRWGEACKHAQAAAEGTKLKLPARVGKKS